MNLEDLFVSYKQVQPATFTPPDFSYYTDTPLYLNLDRAQKVTQDGEPDESIDQAVPESENSYTWSVGTTNKTQQKKPTTSATLTKYRSSSGYSKFKSELDKFIQNNQQYSSIKDSLDYLAALESRYQMDVENKAGSSALGWFQLLDSTRSAYNSQSREDFAKDPQAQLKAAAQHYTALQKQIKNWGGDPNDFVTMYSAWWRPESAKRYIEDNTYDYRTRYNESLCDIRKRASDLLQ